RGSGEAAAALCLSGLFHRGVRFPVLQGTLCAQPAARHGQYLARFPGLSRQARRPKHTSLALWACEETKRLYSSSLVPKLVKCLADFANAFSPGCVVASNLYWPAEFH